MQTSSSSLTELNQKLKSDRLMRRSEVQKVTGISTSVLYREINEGTFPAPVRIGKRTVAWKASEIAAWIDGLQKTVGAEGR